MAPHLTLAVALLGSEQSSQIAHPALFVAVALCVALALRLTAAVDDPELERQSLDVLLDAIADAHLTNKEVCALLKLSAGQWSEICSGQRHTPSHTRLLNLPWAFWSAYLPALAFLLTKYKLDNLVGMKRSA